MRKILLFIACVLCWSSAYSQPVMGYDFESKDGVYEEITGGTIVGAGLLGQELQNMAFCGSAEGTNQLVEQSGFPIGFNLVYNNQVMNQFAIGSLFGLVLGKDKVTFDPSDLRYIFIRNNKGQQNLIQAGMIAPIMGVENTEISYKLIGNAPDRVLVVQYKNVGVEMGNPKAIYPINMQIRLHETTGNIDMVFKGWNEVINDNRVMFRIGLKGENNDYHLRVTETDWKNTSLAWEDKTISWTKESNITDGLTFTFKPCVDCVVPAEQPTEMVLEATTTGVKGQFTPSATADHYVVVMTETEELTEKPASGSYYKMDDKLGNGTVILSDTLTAFETTEILTGGRSYYFHVFGGNNYCMFGPKYNVTNPLVKKIETMPVAPAALEITKDGYEEGAFSVTANETGDKILVAITENPMVKNNLTLPQGAFGVPVGELKEGDEIEGGGKVVYMGATSADIPLSGLKNNTLYFLQAWSLNESGSYSTTFSHNHILTWGKMPYIPDFMKMSANKAPLGWDVEGDFVLNTSYLIECNIKKGNVTDGLQHSLTSQWMLLGEGAHRVVFDYNLSVFGRVMSTPYNDWADNDLFEIQISEDGETYIPIYTVNKDNSPELATAGTYANVSQKFEQFAGKKVKIRIYWKSYAPLVKLLIDNFMVETVPECDYSTNLTIDKASLVEGRALVSWQTNGKETVWEMRTRKAGDEDWNAPFEVRENPYLLTGLPQNTNMEVQVRAKCSATSASQWSLSASFTTGYSIPFAEDFVDNKLPIGWAFETGDLGTPTEFCDGIRCNKYWSVSDNALVESNLNTVNDWALMPVIDLQDGSVHYTLDFDLNLIRKDDTALNEKLMVAVVLSSDAGASFNVADVIWKLTVEELEQIKSVSHISIPLKEYTGVVRPAFYVASIGSESTASLVIDNVAIQPTCPPASNIVVSDITSETAKIVWEGEAEEWLTFFRKTGETNEEFKATKGNEFVLSELLPRTTYEFGITKECSEDDRAKLMVVSFTTEALAPCEPVTEVKVTPKAYEVSFEWMGEAMAYNVKYRKEGAEEWITRQTTQTSLKIEELVPETKYEYAIQAMCSQMEGDVSEWTPTKSFTTLAVTCLPPTEIEFEATHQSVVVTWEGESDKYEVGYRKGSEEWTVEQTSGMTLKIENLEPVTTYQLRIRSICSAEDASLWTEIEEFTTLAIPDCAIPTNLKASSVTEQTAKLTWEVDEANLTWDVRYRDGKVTSWTTIKELNEKEYTLENLEANTLYLWTVKATCDEGRTSAWAAQSQFTTTSTGIQSQNAENVRVMVQGQLISVINSGHVWIKQVQVFNMSGQVIGTYQVNSDENLLLPINVENMRLVIRVSGEGWSQNFSVITSKD